MLVYIDIGVHIKYIVLLNDVYIKFKGGCEVGVYIIGEVVPDQGKDIYQKVMHDVTTFRKSGDTLGLGKAQLVLGEIQRDPKKDYSDENILKLLKVLRKNTLKAQDNDTFLIQLIDTYIPPPVSDEEVKNWFTDHYDKDDVQAMGKKSMSIIGIAKKYFGDRDINSESLKSLILESING